MKRDHDEDDDNDMDIDYGDVLAAEGLSDTPNVPSASAAGQSLVSMGLPEGVDLNLTRGKTQKKALVIHDHSISVRFTPRYKM